MQQAPNTAYWEVINVSLWKQQNIVEFIEETLGDLYLNENPDNLQQVETRLISIEALVDNLKIELHHILPIVQKERER